MAAFNAEDDPKITEFMVELTTAAAAVVIDGTHLLEKGMVGYEK